MAAATVNINNGSGSAGTSTMTPVITDTQANLGISGNETALPIWSTANTVMEQLPVLLASGDNTIAIPTGASFVGVVPPAGSTNAKTARFTGQTGGASFHPVAGFYWAFAATPPANLIINSTSNNAETVLVYFR